MSVSFTLNVFYRGAGVMQTAATLIEFEAAAIAADATVRVDTETINVPALGCAGNACNGVGTGPDGDDILVTRIGGTNRVRLTLTYFGSFAGGLLCGSPTIGVAGRSFAIELTGFTFANGTVGYRIASFMAPSDASCDIPYVRVPSNRPTLGAAVGGTLSKLGRLPLNIVLVLDKSGSMGGPIPGQAAIRWARLKDAVQLFANTWDVIGAPPPPATVSSEGHPEDRLGLVFFDSTASDSNLGSGVFFKSRGAVVLPWGAGVASALAAKTPGGATALGAGVERGRLRLDDVDAVNGDTALVLFTDGEQNTPPCILHQGETMVGGCGVSPPGAGATALLTLNGSLVYPSAPVLAQRVGPRGPIFTIGLGEGGMAASALLLDEIAQETAGTPWFPINGPALDTSFVDSLVNLLKGGTVSSLERFAETLPAAATSGTPLSVAIDPSLTRLVLVLGWEGSTGRVGLEIRRPDETLVQPTLVEAGPGSLVLGLDLPSGGPSGIWQVRVTNSELGPNLMAATANIPRTFAYHLTAYGVESRLSVRVTQSPRLGTGSPLTIVAEIGWDDAGLAGLPAGAIRAVIERPGENLGNVLHDVATPAIDLRPDQTPLMAKIADLAGSAKLLDRVAPRALPGLIPLTDQGDGRYQGTFDGVNVGGQYRVRVDFDWSDPRTGDIHRTEYAERQAAVVPAATGTAVVLQRNPETGAVSLLVTPRDRFGNYVGPGFGNFFTITVDGTAVVLPPIRDPDLTGAYEIALPVIGVGTDPRIGILYRGEPLRDAPLSRIEQTEPTGSGGCCGLGWWHLLLILVVLFILWRLSLS